MGNTGSIDDPTLMNINISFIRLVNQLNHLFDTIPPSGPITPFVAALRQLQIDIQTLQNNEPTTTNLASINSSILTLNSQMQTARDDIIALQNQAVDSMTLQDIQTTLTNLSNEIIALQSSIGSVNVVNLNSLVNSLNTQLTTLNTTVASKVDKSTSINGKQLLTNVTLTKADLGLSLVTNDQQLKRSANDFRSFPIRSTISAQDVILLEDSEVGGSKYCAAVSSLPASDVVTTSLSNKVDKLSLIPTTVGGSNKAVTMSVNSSGQVTAVTDSLINITPSQANLGNVINIDTTNIGNVFVRNSFVPINAIVAVNDSGLNALQKLQGQLNARLVSMVGASSSSNGVSGLVPAPAIGQETAFLRGDGVWASNTMGVSTISSAINPAVANTIYLANTSAGAFNITLPAPVTSGVKIVIVDAGNSFSTNPVTLIPQVGGVINGLTSPLTIKNHITSVYFSLPNNWTVEEQVMARQEFSADAPVIVAPNPALSNSSYTTIASLPTVMSSSFGMFDIQVNGSYSSINPASSYVITISLTIVDDSTSAVIHQVPASITVVSGATTSIYSIPLSYRLYTDIGTNYRFRVDAQITGGAVTSLTAADYDFTFSYKLVGQ